MTDTAGCKEDKRAARLIKGGAAQIPVAVSRGTREVVRRDAGGAEGALHAAQVGADQCVDVCEDGLQIRCALPHLHNARNLWFAPMCSLLRTAICPPMQATAGRCATLREPNFATKSTAPLKFAADARRCIAQWCCARVRQSKSERFFLGFRALIWCRWI